VAVTPPSGESPGCAQLRRQLPQRLDGQQRRRTQPNSPSTDAWGDPAIVLRCGVPRPAAYRQTSELIGINGVDWLPEPVVGGYRFTTVGRAANVEVSVPSVYSPEVDPLVDLAAPIRSALPSEDDLWADP
jgi:hypothetical protein